MTLTAHEFIRRFEQHILPERFTKIRTYGYLSNRNRHQRINEVLKKMKLPSHKGLVKIPIQVRMLEQFGIDVAECPCCKNKTLQLVKIFYPWKHSRMDDSNRMQVFSSREVKVNVKRRNRKSMRWY